MVYTWHGLTTNSKQIHELQQCKLSWSRGRHRSLHHDGTNLSDDSLRAIHIKYLLPPLQLQRTGGVQACTIRYVCCSEYYLYTPKSRKLCKFFKHSPKNSKNFWESYSTINKRSCQEYIYGIENIRTMRNILELYVIS